MSDREHQWYESLHNFLLDKHSELYERFGNDIRFGDSTQKPQVDAESSDEKSRLEDIIDQYIQDHPIPGKPPASH